MENIQQTSSKSPGPNNVKTRNSHCTMHAQYARPISNAIKKIIKHALWMSTLAWPKKTPSNCKWVENAFSLCQNTVHVYEGIQERGREREERWGDERRGKVG